MQYHGIELEEITKPQIFDPPRKMIVWDEDDQETCNDLDVCAIVSGRNFPVICKNSTWRHCAVIPKPKTATYRELARWLAEGKGQIQIYDNIYTIMSYKISQENSPADFKVRKWEDSEWVSPTREYLGLEDE